MLFAKLESAAFSNRESVVTVQPRSSLILIIWIIPSPEICSLFQQQPLLLCQFLNLPSTEWICCLVGDVKISPFSPNNFLRVPQKP